MTETRKTSETPGTYLKMTEATQYSRLSEMSLRRLEGEGKLRFLRPRPRAVLIEKAELDRYLRST
jgi:excisionase family DNA binding protein